MDFPLKGSGRNAALLTEVETVKVPLMTASDILLRMQITSELISSIGAHLKTLSN